MSGAPVTVRPYAGNDEFSVLRVWNSAMFADPITAATWRAKVLLGPNFDPEGCLVAEVVALMNHRTYYGSRNKAGLLGPEETR